MEEIYALPCWCGERIVYASTSCVRSPCPRALFRLSVTNDPMFRLSDSPSSPSVSNLRCYAAYGVSIRSELPLPLPEARGERGPSFFEIEIRAFNESLLALIPQEATLQHNPLGGFDFGDLPDGSAYVCWANVGEALISRDGGSIACRPFPSADSESFYVYLLAQALSFALVKGGFEPLHATAVSMGDQAVAFVGDCGFGKSTLAAAFLQMGHRLITDDLLLLRATKKRILAYPGPARIKLFPEIASRFLRATARGVPMNPNTQKLVIPLSDNQVCADPLPLTAIYGLSPRNQVAGGETCIAPISQREAFVMLLGSTFNYVICNSERLRRQFEATEAIVNMVMVKRLSYPRSLERLPMVGEAILSDFRAARPEKGLCNA
jgi:hypothetical protein